ncbi:putative Ig domain-containing protein [Methanolobus sp. ZRKC4]|uniref:putative Ig domain-containing protein n=1 Tax=Methanolobus sp. ZRKC4 TaxID=3125787 RepID=UPI0032523201
MIPGFGDEGSYEVTFIATSNVLEDYETITITVGDVDRAPELASIGNKAVVEDDLLSFTVSATDPDGDTITYSSIGLPSELTLVPVVVILAGSLVLEMKVVMKSLSLRLLMFLKIMRQSP